MTAFESHMIQRDMGLIQSVIVELRKQWPQGAKRRDALEVSLHAHGEVVYLMGADGERISRAFFPNAKWEYFPNDGHSIFVLVTRP